MVSIEEPRLGGLRLGFIIAYEESPYAGVVRPFINWAKELRRWNIKADLLLYKVGERIINHVKFLGLGFEIIDDLREIKGSSYDYIIIDDYIRRLKLTIKTIPSNKLFVYAQVLHGIHAISTIFKPLNIRERILFSVARYLPFTLVRRRYSELMRKTHGVIANSNITLTMLHILYGIEPLGVVYPPVDSETFRPHNVRKKDQILLYLGSNAGGDTDVRLVKKIFKVLKDKRYKILVFGNKLLQEIIQREFKVEPIHEVNDAELANIYSESILTICPQKWETFGYVIAESIASGTPVIAFNTMGSAEIARLTKLVLLANNENEFLKIISRLEDIINKAHTERIDPHGLPFSLKNSTRMLVEVISQYSLHKAR